MKFSSYLQEGDVIDIKDELGKRFASNLANKINKGFDIQNKAEADAADELEKLKEKFKNAYSKVRVVGFRDISEVSYFLVSSNLFMSNSIKKIYDNLSGSDRKRADFILEKGMDFVKVAEDIKKAYDDYASKWHKKQLAKEYYAPLSAVEATGYTRHALYNDILHVKDFIRRMGK